MRAAIYHRHGGPEVLEVRDLPEPRQETGKARVRVHAAALNPKDVLLRKGRMKMLRVNLPTIPGFDIAGELIDGANGWPAGTPVFGMIQSNQGGACAEVASLHFHELARKPDGLSMAQAASLPLAALTALQGLRDELGVRPGQTVLLNGASGGVGTLAVQIAKAMGAEVVAVCSGRNAELVTELGADRVIDYTTQQVTEERGLDHIFDIYGSLPWSKAKPMLGRGGRFCTTIPRPGSIARGLLRKAKLHPAALVVVQSRRADLEQLAAWVASGDLRPRVDLEVPLERSHEGHAHLETRRARGKVVVTVG